MSLIAGHGSMPTGVSYTTRTKPILFGLTQEWSQRTHGTKRILPEIADTALHRYSSTCDYRKVLVYEEGEIRCLALAVAKPIPMTSGKEA